MLNPSDREHIAKLNQSLDQLAVQLAITFQNARQTLANMAAMLELPTVDAMKSEIAAAEKRAAAAHVDAVDQALRKIRKNRKAKR